MKNIVTVKRLNDSARRIYALPETVTVPQGTLVQVETSYGGHLYGITETPSTLLEDSAVAIIRSTLGFNPDGEFLKVEALFLEPELIETGTEEPD